MNKHYFIRQEYKPEILIMHVFMSLVSNMLQWWRSILDMLSYSIRSSNTLNIIIRVRQAKLTLGLGLELSVIVVIFQSNFHILHYHKVRAFSIPMINTLRLWMLVWPSGQRRRSVVRVVQMTRLWSRDKNLLFVFHKYILL